MKTNQHTMTHDNTNRGALFRNDKQGNEKRPDYRGKLDVEGREYKLSAWIREKKDGSGKFMSLSIEPVDPPPPSAHQQAKQNAYQQNAEDGDDIPF